MVWQLHQVCGSDLSLHTGTLGTEQPYKPHGHLINLPDPLYCDLPASRSLFWLESSAVQRLRDAQCSLFKAERAQGPGQTHALHSLQRFLSADTLTILEEPSPIYKGLLQVPFLCMKTQVPGL